MIRGLLHSLPARLMLGVLLLGLILGGALFVGVLYLVTEDYKTQFVNGVRTQSHLITKLLGHHVRRGELEPLLEDMLLTGQIVGADFADARSGERRMTVGALRPEPVREDFFFGEHGDRVYYVAVPVTDARGAPLGTLTLGYDESYTGERIALVHRRAWYLAVAYTFLLLVLAGALGRQIGRPLRRLRETAHRIASGVLVQEFSMRSSVTEIADLSAELERMRCEIVRRGEELTESGARHRAVVENAAEAILTLDRDGRIESFNAAAERLFGYRFAEVVGTYFRKLLASDDVPLCFYPDGTPRAVAGATLHASRRDGAAVPLMLSVGRMMHGDTPLYTVVALDISERVVLEERLLQLAYYDTLTGLPNRRLFQDRLNQELKRAERHENLVGILFLDLDRFKDVNDTLGHAMGDRLLQVVAKRLQEVVRRDDTVARLGGDEFVVVLPDIANVVDAETVSQKILDLFSRPLSIGEREMFVSASIGVTLYPFDDNDAESLIKNADVAMYRAKAHGGNTYRLYDPGMRAEVAGKLELATALRKATARGDLRLHYQPQMQVHYQPQIDGAGGRIIGAEALLRWRHPQLGLLYPERFIPLAEETGLIVPIGEWVLREACRQAVAWRAAGLTPFPVAVNVSARQIESAGFAQLVARILEEAGLEPGLLDLELTESMVLHGKPDLLATLKELREIGVRISIDDLGTGHSSLSNLQSLAIDAVKIDRTFVRDITDSPHSATIAVAVIDIARKLGLRVVAEGVETEGQLSYLYAHGCAIMQGYHFCQPLPPEEFEMWLHRYAKFPTPQCEDGVMGYGPVAGGSA